MVAWMRQRGPGRQPSNEMGASMGLATDVGSLLMIEHVVMFRAMLVAMRLRRDEYTHGHVHHKREAVVTA